MLLRDMHACCLLCLLIEGAARRVTTDHKELAEAVARRIASEKLSYRQARALKSTILKEAEEKTSKISAAAA